ncbi:uncharacterized protein HGUI_02532 [Hanseniaspora guilliermondii]|uniref:Uncharacterized protein n=1 Tax=Hanseniaspora guilliermondii TaxID=56406 RepID=A0A1L0B3G8_9ASCO|nr:uncharacterized protein HGUI_02532 [Hanseniaspora guilliermondii]
MTSILSFQDSLENTPQKSQSNQLFTSFLRDFYEDNTPQNIKRNNSYINNTIKSKQYHLRHNSSHINTVTNLDSSNSSSNNIQSINTLLKDFNEFHRLQDINHRNRLSKYNNDFCIPIISNPLTSNETSNGHAKGHVKRFSIYSLKQLTLMNKTQKKMNNDENSTSSISNAAIKRNHSLKRKSSITYKFNNNKRTIPLFKNKSKLYQVSAFAHKNNKDKLTKKEVFEIITRERLRVLDPQSEISKVLFKRINVDSYTKNKKIINYSSDINLRSKLDSQQITKSDLNRTYSLWNQLLTHIIASNIKDNLNSRTSSNLFMNEQSSELGSILEQKINQYINKNRQHVSYATTLENTQFSQNYTESDNDIDEFEFIGHNK